MDARLTNEIEHGKYLAREGAGEIWNWESPAGKVRWQRRVAMLTSHIERGSLVLELGCGTGYFTREIAKTGAAVTAVDISPELIGMAKKAVISPSVDFCIANAYQLHFTDRSYHSVIGSSVLHHLDVEKSLHEAFRVLKPGGVMSFTEPNMLNPQIALQKNIPFLKRKLGDSPDETAFFRWPLRRLLAKTGFIDIRIQPFDFLHPAVPQRLIGMVATTGSWFEKTPILREIAGSLFITARKP